MPRGRRNSFPVQIKAELNEPLIKQRKAVEDPAQNCGPSSVTPLQDNVDRELFEIFNPALHFNFGFRVSGFGFERRGCPPS